MVWFGERLIYSSRDKYTSADTKIHFQFYLSAGEMCLCCCTSTSHQTKPIGHKTYFFIFRFISSIYLISPSYLSIEVNKIAFWLFWYLFFSNWFGSLSGIEIAKFELLEAVLRSGGQEKPPNPHTHVILIVKNPSMTYF